MSQTRKHFAAAEKVAILRRHLLEQAPISDLCDEYSIHPTIFYRWQKQLFENGTAAFEYRPKDAQIAANKKLATLEEKLVRKNEVLSELMEEYVRLRKHLGMPRTDLGPTRGSRCRSRLSGLLVNAG